MLKLSEADLKTNNFDFLRFIAASAVIVSHAFTLHGLDSLEPLERLGSPIRLGALAVMVFFVLSGFLISRSWLEQPNLYDYFVKRFLRIFPALIIAVLFTVYVVGYLNTSAAPEEYLKHYMTQDYLKNILMFEGPFRDWLPGVFENNPSRLINGSLWTLPVEMFMYISVAVLGLLSLMKKRVFVTGIAVLLIVLDFLYTQNLLQSSEIMYISTSNIARLGGFFYVGSLAYAYRKNIPLNGYWFLISIIVFLLGISTKFASTICYFSLPYIVLFLALGFKNKGISNFGKYGDFSYGLYVYAWPVQQSVQHLWGPRLDLAQYFILCFSSILLLAVASWYLIEKPAIGLRKYLVSLRR